MSHNTLRLLFLGNFFITKLSIQKYASDVPDFKYMQLNDLKQEDQNFSTIKHLPFKQKLTKIVFK